jgi:hypothetical protein
VPRARLVAVLALAAPLALAACGESDEEAFNKDFRGVNTRIVALGKDVGTTVNGATRKKDTQIEDEFGELSQRAGELAQDLDELEPPDKLKATKEALVKSLGDAEDSLGAIEQAAAKHDADAARKATIQLVGAADDLRDSREKLERATR